MQQVRGNVQRSFSIDTSETDSSEEFDEEEEEEESDDDNLN